MGKFDRRGRDWAGRFTTLTVFACVVMAVFAESKARAGDALEAAANAERLLAAGKPREAYDAMQRAAEAYWAASPLDFRRILFVTKDPEGFGVYQPRETNLYKAGDTILVYGEPFGFGYAKDGETSKIAFEITLSTADADGKVVIQPRSGSIVLKSRRENREFMLFFSYEPRGLKPGAYALLAEFRDTSSGKASSARMPFRIE